MALSAAVKAPEAIQGSPSISGRDSFLFRPPFQISFSVQRRPPFRLTLAVTLARRRNLSSSVSSSSSSSKKKKRNFPPEDNGDVGEDLDGVDGDALEALFSQLEEDLKNDEVALGNDYDEDEFSEEDLSKLEHELGLLLGIDDDAQEEGEVEEEGEEDIDDDEEAEKPIKLKNWQLRRLASALKTGRRKTSIKNLAADLCLDRALVLELLRDPPPNLLMLSATLSDTPTPSVLETKTISTTDVESVGDTAEEAKEVKVPVHVMQQSWTAEKRLKKVQVETLERVYRRTKRPTNAMIKSIVQVTNLPRRRVVKWFEDKRAEDGVPDSRLPYARSVPKSV